jgi:hypothetical protein
MTTTVPYDRLPESFSRMRDYLSDLSASRRLASRQAVNPLQIRDLLPFINLVDVFTYDDCFRFRFRLVGTAQTESAGREYTNAFVDEVVDADQRPRVLGILTQAVLARAPIYGRFPVPFNERSFIDAERVFFPLSAHDDIVDAVLILHNYPKDKPARSDDWHLRAWKQSEPQPLHA